VTQVTQYRPYLKAQVELIKEDVPAEQEIEVRALGQSALGFFQRVWSSRRPSPTSSPPWPATSRIRPAWPTHRGSLPSLNTAQKQEFLEVLDVRTRLERVNKVLVKDLEVLEVGSKIQSQVKSELQKNQREYYLREQMKASRRSWATATTSSASSTSSRRRSRRRECRRRRRRRPCGSWTASPHVSGSGGIYGDRTYLDWLVALPWSKRTEGEIDLVKAKEVLDNDHYDLEKVKDRILEYLAVRKMKPDIKGPILCFVGPPGWARPASQVHRHRLGRKFHRLSLGGMRTRRRSAAIAHLHRRLPGQIIQGLRRTETKNRSSSSTRWTRSGPTSAATPRRPSWSARPEQNNTFKDHYIDLPFDLSEVLFITTATSWTPCPRPARPHGVIRLAGYTEERSCTSRAGTSFPAARQPRPLREIVAFGTRPGQADREYTERRASGTWSARSRASSARWRARRRKGRETVAVTPRRSRSSWARRTSCARRWTSGPSSPSGPGPLLDRRRRRDPLHRGTQMFGKKGLNLTGQLGDVMKESAQTALPGCAHARQLGIEDSFFERVDLHLHVPRERSPRTAPPPASPSSPRSCRCSPAAPCGRAWP